MTTFRGQALAPALRLGRNSVAPFQSDQIESMLLKMAVGKKLDVLHAKLN